MDLKEYAEAVARTAKPFDDEKTHRIVATMGLLGEIGELVEKIKHQQVHGHDVYRTEILEEIGDAAWYLTEYCRAHAIETDLWTRTISAMPPTSDILQLVHQLIWALAGVLQWSPSQGAPVPAVVLPLARALAVLARAYGSDIEQVLEANVAKLRKRYPEGFRCEDSRDRDVEQEYAAMEEASDAA